MNEPISVQPEWCTRLPIQQQSVLFLAARGPDGVPKYHPSKDVVRAYRACVLKAAVFGRETKFSDPYNDFMTLECFREDTKWKPVVNSFFDEIDQLPHHYLMHLIHGAEILGYKHPYPDYRKRWYDFYCRNMKGLHANIETEEQMDNRLSDWGRKHWD